MRKAVISIQDTFVLTLFANQTFRQELTRFQHRQDTVLGQTSTNQSSIVIDEICQMLAQSYRNTIDSETINIYQTYSQITKEIDNIKSRLSAFQSNKSEGSTTEKEKTQNIQALSDISIDQERGYQQLRKNLMCSENKNSIAMDCFFDDNWVTQFRDEIQDKIKSSVSNMSNSMTKFQINIEERFKNLQGAVNKKIQNIFKTFTNVFETINEIQSKQGEIAKPITKNPLQKLFDSKQLPTRQKLPQTNSLQVKQPNRRRSFLGFKY